MSKQRGIGIFILIVLIFSTILLFNSQDKTQSTEVTLSEILTQYDKGNIEELFIDGNSLEVTLRDGTHLSTQKLPADTLESLNIDPKKTKVNIKDTSKDGIWTDLLISFLPLVFIILIIAFMFRQVQGSSNSAFSFGKSKDVLFQANKHQIGFKDVAGVLEAKEELSEIVDFLKNPQKYTDIGAKIPRGVILYGPPGTGKTLLARAVAGEAKVPFFSISGSEFVEMFVGVGASRVRDLFNKAKKNAPCIIFIDEIDAVGRQRGTGVGGGNDEREQTLNQILVEMDGFDNQTNVIVMAATNRPDVLDPALLRPGRFDRRITIDLPDLKAREEILLVHSKGKPLDSSVKINTIAQKTIGFSGADLSNVMNEAAILTARGKRKVIKQEDLEEAVEKVIMGPELKSRIPLEEEKINTSYHEAGHAIVGANLKYCHPVHKITVVSRGMSLGATWFLPKDDIRSSTKIKFEHELASLLGGRVAEEIKFGKDHITTGAANDLEKATRMARAMVTQYGMSDKLGARIYGEKHGSIFLGRDLAESRNFSDETASKIDEEVLNIIQEAYKTAKDILKKNIKQLDKLAHILIKKETIYKEEFEKVLGKKQACEQK